MTTRINHAVDVDPRSVIESVPEIVRSGAQMALDADVPSVLFVTHLADKRAAHAFLASVPDEHLEKAERGIADAWERGQDAVVAKIVACDELAAVFEGMGEWSAAESIIADPEPGTVVVVGVSGTAWWIGTAKAE